jgi:hypothetical protein
MCATTGNKKKAMEAARIMNRGPDPLGDHVLVCRSSSPEISASGFISAALLDIQDQEEDQELHTDDERDD